MGKEGLETQAVTGLTGFPYKYKNPLGDQPRGFFSVPILRSQPRRIGPWESVSGATPTRISSTLTQEQALPEGFFQTLAPREATGARSAVLPAQMSQQHVPTPAP